MAEFDKTVVIAAPVRDVYDHVSQPEHFPTFLPITDFQFLTDMHRGVGTRVRYNFTVGGKSILTECSLTKLEVDENVSFHTTRGAACDWAFTFKEVEAGTQLHWEGEHETPVGVLDRLLGRTANLERAMGTTVDDSLQKLKEALESR